MMIDEAEIDEADLVTQEVLQVIREDLKGQVNDQTVLTEGQVIEEEGQEILWIILTDNLAETQGQVQEGVIDPYIAMFIFF